MLSDNLRVMLICEHAARPPYIFKEISYLFAFY